MRHISCSLPRTNLHLEREVMSRKTIHKEYAHPIAQTSPLWIVAVQGQFWEWLRLALSSCSKNSPLPIHDILLITT